MTSKEAITLQNVIDTKFDDFTKRKMKDYLGEMDEELIMCVIEHLKDHKGPTKLIEALEPVSVLYQAYTLAFISRGWLQVLMEEAEEFVILLWRQIVFESVAYAEGLETREIVLA